MNRRDHSIETCRNRSSDCGWTDDGWTEDGHHVTTHRAAAAEAGRAENGSPIVDCLRFVISAVVKKTMARTYETGRQHLITY